MEWSDSAPGVTVLLVAGEAWTTGCQVVVLVVLVEVVLLVVVLVVVVTNCSNCSNPLPARRSGPGQAAAWCSTGPRRTGARGLAHLAKATHTFTPKK